MKKITALTALTSILLSSCGGPAAPTPAPAPSTPDTNATGTITFTLRPAAAAQGMQGQALPTPTNIRVLISHANGFKFLKDIPVTQTTTTVEAKVPVNTGYKLEAFSYVSKSNYFKSILKEGVVSGINVTAGQVTPVNLILEPITMSLSLPAEVVSGDPFTLNITRDNTVLGPFTSVRVAATPAASDEEVYTKSTHISAVGPTSAILNAPTVDVAGTMYVNSVTFVDARFVNSTENYVSFKYFTPSVDFGDAPKTAVLKLPEGGIGIGITY